MRVQAGTKFGPYEILAPLGLGGMGEVYRATDTRLKRTVAIKVLPPHFSDNPEMKQRFAREAQVIAGLNHPHICTLYDVGRHASSAGSGPAVDFLVMEYLEGETLAERLTKGALPFDQALTYAIEIADALDKAHRKGIVHRDLKPGNIMLTKGGTKLLDFGLAKLRVRETDGLSRSALPTESAGLTAAHTIVGTLPYMAPEQVQGNDLDARTDIFAFGAVVYEMVTGKRAFEGSNQASVIAALLKDEPPPISSWHPMTPVALDRIVRTCLAKDRDERWQTATDLRRELRWASETATQVASATPPSVWRSRVVWALLVLLGVVSAVAIAVLATSNRSRQLEKSAGVQQFSIALPETAPLVFVGDAALGVGQPALALSPDGSRLVYVGGRGNASSLYLRPINSIDAKALDGTAGAYAPFFSPDGNWVGFFAGNYLKKLAVAGGAPVTLAEVDSPWGATWGRDGAIYVAVDQASQLMRVPEAGGPPQVVSTRSGVPNSPGTGPFRWPEMLPGGDVVIYGAARNRIAALSLKTGEQKILLEGGGPPRYVPTGHLVFPRSGQLMAVAFDPVRLEVRGTPVPILDGVRTESLEAAQLTMAPDGTLIYASGTRGDVGRLAWVGPDRSVRPLPFPPARYGNFRISPNGRELAIIVFDVTTDIWVYDLVRDSRRKFGAGAGPIWTPDGKRVTFSLNGDVVWKNADGSGQTETLVSGPRQQGPQSWSPDGQALVFAEAGPPTDLMVLTLRPERKVQPFATGPSSAGGAQFSPDGRWVAYFQDEAGQDEIYVQPYPPTGQQWQISTGGGGNEEAAWSPDGSQLYYRRGRTWMAVDVTPGAKFDYKPPRVAFQGDFLNIPGISYGVAPDGRFLVVQEEGAPTAGSLHVVRNWFEELKRLVPAK